MSVSDALVFKIEADAGKFHRVLSGVERAGVAAGGRIAGAFGGAGTALQATEKRAQLSRQSFARIGGALLTGAKAATAMGAGLAAIGAAAITTGAEFETLEARLSTLLGSAAAGKERMEELFSVATSTPFELGELVEADAIMESFGVNAQANRGAIMDLSGALGLSLTESAAAVGRAFAGGAGAADILRERGVLAMMELRTGIAATDMSAGEFREQLIATLTDPEGRIAGGSARLAATFRGTLSNLQDAFTKFRKDIADSGLFEGVKAGAREFLAILEENEAQIGELAEGIGLGILTAIQMAVKGVGYLVDGWTMARTAVQGVVYLSETAAAGFARFIESQIRDFDGLFGVLSRAAEAIGLDGLAKTFEGAGRGFSSLADTVGTRAAGMEASARASRLEFERLADTIGDASADANRIVNALNTRSGGSVRSRGASAATAPRAAAGGGSGASVAATDPEAAAIEQQNEALRTQLDIVDQVTAHRLGAIEQVDAAEADAMARLKAWREENLAAVGDDLNAQLEVTEAYLEAESAIRDEFHQRRLDQQNEIAKLSAQGAASMFGDIAQTFGNISELVGESNKKAALQAFAIQKGAAMTQAAINAALAATNALANVPAPFNIGAAATVGALAATQIALIAKQQPPSFEDTPGVVQIGSSGGNVRVGGGDYVAAAKSPDDLRRQVRGMDGKRDAEPRLVPVLPVFQGRTWEVGTRSQTRRPGPLRDAIRGAAGTTNGRSGW